MINPNQIIKFSNGALMFKIVMTRDRHETQDYQIMHYPILENCASIGELCNYHLICIAYQHMYSWAGRTQTTYCKWLVKRIAVHHNHSLQHA